VAVSIMFSGRTMSCGHVSRRGSAAGDGKRDTHQRRFLLAESSRHGTAEGIIPRSPSDLEKKYSL